MKEGNKVSVAIYGMELSIVSSEDPSRTRQYAVYVDTLMRDIAGRMGGHTDFSRVAALALLQVTHDLFDARDRADNDNAMFNAKMKRLLQQIDAATSISGVQTEIVKPGLD